MNLKLITIFKKLTVLGCAIALGFSMMSFSPANKDKAYNCHIVACTAVALAEASGQPLDPEDYEDFYDDAFEMCMN